LSGSGASPPNQKGKDMSVVAEDREEWESCERGTQGCSVNHTASGTDSDCEGW